MIGILNIGGNKLGISKYQVIIHSRNGDELMSTLKPEHSGH